jgi:Tol biopolymer transport system component
MSYDYVVKDNRQLAAGNYFNDVITAGSRVYYAPSSSLQPNGASLFRMKPDGGSKQTLLPQETWNIFRTAYDKLVLSVPGTWYEYTLDAATPVKLEGQPASLVSRVYVDSPDGKNSLWVDTRDGKGVLLMYDVNAKSDKILRTQSGLKNPVRWLNDRTVVYRINTDQETADYAMSLDGGDPVKIRDVTNTGGIDKWYYY